MAHFSDDRHREIYEALIASELGSIMIPSLCQKIAEIARECEKAEYYRVNEQPNTIDFADEDHFHHQFDPLGDLTTLLTETDLVKNSDVSFAKVIVRFVGYTESNVEMPYGSRFWCSKHDVEQCYVISFSPKSTYSAYWITSFRCEVSLRANGVYCATMLEWNRKKMFEGKENIIWQSEMRSLKAQNHVVDSTNIADFEMNIKLDADKIYMIRIDIPEGGVSCGGLRQNRNESDGYLVHAIAHLYHNKYSLRDPPHKRYSVTLTC